MMTMLSNTWATAWPRPERVNEVLDTIPEVQDCRMPCPYPTPPPARIAFENVAFHYNGDRRRRGAGGHQPGRRAGADGGDPGRHRRRQVDAGQPDPALLRCHVRPGAVDGIDVRQLQQDSLLAHVGIVPQETILFSGTVRDNIRYGRPDGQRGRGGRGRAGRPGPRVHLRCPGLRHACRGARRRTSPAGRSSASPSPARCSPSRRS